MIIVKTMAQKMERISWHAEDASRIRQTSRGLVEDWNDREVPYEKLILVNSTHLVPKPGGKFRLVTDGIKVNRFMKHAHFKMEGVPTLKDLIEKNEFAISFDLKKAYNHVPVHHSMKNLLGMCWRGEAYRFVGMPFGLNDST
jgi:hypothetical protein